MKRIIAAVLSLALAASTAAPVQASTKKGTEKLNKTKITLFAGESQTIKVVKGKAASWQSSNRGVATVKNGKITTKKKGSATITCTTKNKKKLKCKVTVKDSILNKKTLTLETGKTAQLKLTGAAVKSWESSNKKVATVSKGLVKAVGAGKATITCTTKGNKKYKCTVTVPVPKDYTAEQKAAYQKIMALQKDYPEGAAWNNNNCYEFKDGSGALWLMGGCAGFAYLLNDTAFKGKTIKQHKDFSQLKVGDVVCTDNGMHYVCILEVHPDYVVVAEGNYGGTVHWGRQIPMDEFLRTSIEISTRY